MIKILFVCMGNICRSPMAEAIFAHLVQQAGLSDQFEIDSAGTLGHSGNPAHPGTREILQQQQIDYIGHSRKVKPQDLTNFDYVVAMDYQNLRDLKRLAEANKVQLLLDFAAQSSIREVPDPYYDGNFARTYALILDGCQGLLAHIKNEQVL